MKKMYDIINVLNFVSFFVQLFIMWVFIFMGIVWQLDVVLQVFYFFFLQEEEERYEGEVKYLNKKLIRF